MSERMHLPRGPRRGDQLDVEIHAIDPRAGAGVGHLDVTLGPQAEERTLTVVVPKTVPGDVVRTDVLRYRKRKVETRIAEILTPSPMRSEPRCSHFGVFDGAGRGCGGCSLQSLEYEAQLEVKAALVQRLIERAGLDADLLKPVLGMDDPWYYRNKMEFSFGTDDDGHVGVGLRPTGFRYEVIDVEACYLQSPFAAEFLPEIRRWVSDRELPVYHFKRGGWLRQLMVREGKRTGQRLVELMTSHDSMAGAHAAKDMAREFAEICAKFDIDSVYWTQQRAVRGEKTSIDEHLLAGNATLREELHLPGDHVLAFDIHPRAFFQPNTRQAERLYAKVVERAGLDGTQRVLDLYCGTGTIGLALSPWAKSVVGIEMQPNAVDNARKNAATNGIEHVEFICGDVGKVLAEKPLEADTIIVDPPRSGLLAQALDHIDAVKGATRLVYVSCNPQALATNLVELHGRGWTTRSIEPVDMFPHTYHIENVALLER